MADGISLLNVIREGGYSASLITTYNAWLPFYEEVVFRRLRGAGIQHNVVLMDAAQCTGALQEAPPRLAGRDYTLVPISGALFHPKILLLVGEKRAQLCIGSHNLTLSGFGLNWEVTTRFERSDAETQPAIQAVWAWLRENLAGQPAPIQAALDGIAALGPSWMKSPPKEPSHALMAWPQEPGKPENPPLWEQLRPRLPQKARRIWVVGPYFDKKLGFLRTLQEELRPTELRVGIAPETSMVPSDAPNILPEARFVDLTGASPGEREAFIHGKLLWIEGDDGSEHLIAGSANPSAPAWLHHSHRNVEAVVHRTEAGLAQALQLPALEDLPVVSEAAWAQIAARQVAQDPQDELILRQQTAAPLLAMEEPGRLRLSQPITVTDAAFLDSSGTSLAAALAVESETLLSLSGPIPETACLLQLTVSGSSRLAILHRSLRIEAQSRGHRQRAIQQALASLQGENPDLMGLLSAIEDVLFEAPPEPRPRSRQRTHTPGPSSPADHGYVADPATDRSRHSEEDLILDALLSRLGPVEEDDDDTPRVSEQSLIGSEDEVAVRHRIEGSSAVSRVLSRWHRKLDLIATKLMAELADKSTDPARRMRRVAAVLSLVHRMRGRELHAVWLPAGEQLIPGTLREKLYIGLMDALPGKRGLLSHPVERRAEVLALLQWLALDQKRPHRPADAAAACCRQRTLIEALDAIPGSEALVLRALELGTAPEWLDEEISQWSACKAWVESLQALEEVAVTGRSPRAGDLALTRVGPRFVTGRKEGRIYTAHPGRAKPVAYLERDLVCVPAPPTPDHLKPRLSGTSRYW